MRVKRIDKLSHYLRHWILTMPTMLADAQKNNESEIPLIDKSGNIQQLTANVIKECEYLHSYLNIDNAISKDDLTIMIKEAESIVIDMYNKAKEIETQITSMKVNDIKKDISDMNNKFILLKDHFDKENKKYQITKQKENKLHLKLYNSTKEDQVTISISQSFSVISSYLLQIQMIFINLYRILSIDYVVNDISLNVESKEETTQNKFEFSSMISLILCMLSIIFFIIYIYIYYLK